MAYFPMFVDLTKQNCLVVGGGNVALRKIRLLLDFEARVEVVTMSSCQELMELARTNPKVHLIHREFCDCDVKDKMLVIAATNDVTCNHKISELCKKQRIPVNVVDTKEDCSFIVPSYVREKDVVAAFSSAGKSPVLTQYLKQKEYEHLTPLIGEINDFMGEGRELVKNRYQTERERKHMYQRLLAYALEINRVPTQLEVESILNLDRG